MSKQDPGMKCSLYNIFLMCGACSSQAAVPKWQFGAILPQPYIHITFVPQVAAKAAWSKDPGPWHLCIRLKLSSRRVLLSNLGLQLL